MRLTCPGLGLYENLVASDEVDSVKASLLGFGVYDMVVDGVCGRLVPVCSQGLIPVGIAYPLSLIGA